MVEYVFKTGRYHDSQSHQLGLYAASTRYVGHVASVLDLKRKTLYEVQLQRDKTKASQWIIKLSQKVTLLSETHHALVYAINLGNNDDAHHVRHGETQTVEPYSRVE